MEGPLKQWGGTDGHGAEWRILAVNEKECFLNWNIPRTSTVNRATCMFKLESIVNPSVRPGTEAETP